MTRVSQAECQAGWEVVGSDGVRIGRVQACRDTDFLVSWTDYHDLSMPYEAVGSVDKDRIVLTIPAAEAETMGWAYPRATGTPGGPCGTPHVCD